MKKYFPSSLLILLSLTTGLFAQQVPDFTETDCDGVTHHLFGELTAGNAVILNFCAGWCFPCRLADPLLEEVYQEYCKENSNVKTYGMLFETNTVGEQSDCTFGQEYAADYDLTFPIITDIGTWGNNSSGLTGEYDDAFGLTAIPTFYVIIPNTSDPANSTVHTLTGWTPTLKDDIIDVLSANGYAPSEIIIDPNLVEICDGEDNDCDGFIDEGFDQDGDGFTTCEGDCNDNDSNIFPGATEICNNKDDDCNGMTDEGEPGTQTFSAIPNLPIGPQADCIVLGSGSGGNSNTINVAGIGTLDWASGVKIDKVTVGITHEYRQDIQLSLVSPTGQELYLEGNAGSQGLNLYVQFTDEASIPVDDFSRCGNPNNCNSAPGPTARPQSGTFQDTFNGLNADGDWILKTCDIFEGLGGTLHSWSITFGGLPGPSVCDTDDDMDGFTVTQGDCNDNDPAIFPGNPEICDGKDNNCDGNVDEGTLSALCSGTTVQLDGSGNVSVNAIDLNNGSAGCGSLDFSVGGMSSISFDCTDIGVNSVILTITDNNGSETCTTSVTVQDLIPPSANCKTATIQLNVSGNHSFLQNEIFDGGTDNCGSVSFVSAAPSMVDCTDAGTTIPVTVTVSDGNGNTKNCTAMVFVEDVIPPVPGCLNKTVQLDGNGSYILQEADVYNGGTDNCGTVNFEGMSISSLNCSHINAPVSVTVTVSDNNSNTATCMANITVTDQVAPSANCITTTINASLDANGLYNVDPNDLDDGSSDACGIQNLTSNPSLLDCSNEGPNTATLTVTDNNGNSSTCPVTIDVAEFLTLDPPVATAESCAGAGDGSIVITATAGGGQLGFSIDGGANFQFNNSFNNLTPGTYNVAVRIFGIPAVCEKTTTATVNIGNNPGTWYKDLDNDGYTDGITQVGCNQPPGYIDSPAAGTDCNDNDADEHPGQTWYEDLDGDNYGSGIWFTSCARPSDCFLASELMATDTDCDDGEVTVHPMATEVCDGLDNDCDNEVDEGFSGTYIGNVLFTSQAQLDAWLACYDVIQGNVTVQGGNITDLTPLTNIVEITGNLVIATNSILASLNGLENLADVGGALYLYYNFQLSDCCAIDDLLTNNGVGGATIIFFNATGSFCNSEPAIEAACPVAPLIGGGSTNGSTQACSDCTPQELLTVYPNPASTTINVKWTGDDPSGTVQLTDQLGRVLMQQELQSSNQFNVFKLRSGNYAVRVKADGYKQQVKRVVVDR